MAQYFSYNYTGAPFTLFGTGHLLSLLTILLVNILLLRFRKTPEGVRRLVRWTMAVLIWIDEAAWHIWTAAWGHWNIQTALPMHLCSLLIWLTGFMLIFKSYRIYEFSYFLGIAGAAQALLTPDAGIYGFPHFRIFQTLISHGLLLTSAVYMTTVEGFRPTWKSLLKVVIGTNLYMLAIGLVNGAIGSNYLYIAHKPATATLLDLLPAWPWYILWMEIIGLAMCLVLYLPFVIKDRRLRAGAV